MTDFSLTVQSVIYNKLLTDISPIPVYDDVPQDLSAFPYVTIGEDVLTFNDTDTDRSNNVSITVHTWSRERGRKETKQIQSQIYDSLHLANLVKAGYNFVVITEQSSTTFLDADGLTRHGVQTFKLIIEED